MLKRASRSSNVTFMKHCLQGAFRPANGSAAEAASGELRIYQTATWSAARRLQRRVSGLLVAHSQARPHTQAGRRSPVTPRSTDANDFRHSLLLDVLPKDFNSIFHGIGEQHCAALVKTFTEVYLSATHVCCAKTLRQTSSTRILPKNGCAFKKTGLLDRRGINHRAGHPKQDQPGSRSSWSYHMRVPLTIRR